VSSSSPSEPSESSESPSPDFYCSDFTDPVATFAVLKPQLGDWEIASDKLQSGEGRAGPQVIIHDSIWKSGDIGYEITGKITPLTELGNGHLIFGYKNPDDFWFAGVSLNALGEEPGAFYLGRKSAERGLALDDWPEGLNYGYFFVQAGSPSVDFGLPGSAGGSPQAIGEDGIWQTPVKVVVDVSPIAPGSPTKLIQVKFIWDVVGPDPFATIITTVSPDDSDLYGYCGLGTVGSQTEFDDFGIDCSVF
jgi:hypothetical protein